MKKSAFLCLAFTALALMLSAPGAFAGTPLNAATVERFIATMAPVNELGTQMKKEGRDPSTESPVDGSGTFSAYSSSIAMLKQKFAGDYNRLGGIVKEAGFSSPEQWAEVGDAVMLSYIALKSEQSGTAYEEMKAQMTPEALAKMPPEARASIEKSLQMMESFKAAPAADKAVVAPFVAKIDQAMNAGATPETDAPVAATP